VSYEASKDGLITLSADSKSEDPFTGFANTYAGVGIVFNPPIEGLWTCTAVMDYSCFAFVNVSEIGGAASTGTSYARIDAYDDGNLVSGSTIQGTNNLWSISSNPSFFGGNKVVEGDRLVNTMTFPYIEMVTGLTYVFWVWYSIETSNGINAEGYGQLQATVSEFTFFTTD
jgi:hypothetical protein